MEERLLRDLPGVPGLLAPVARGNRPQACPQRRGDRTTRLDRPLVPRTPCEETSGHRILSRVRGDHEPPLLMDRMRGNLLVFCPTPKANYFFQKGWTGRNVLRLREKLDFRCTRCLVILSEIDVIDVIGLISFPTPRVEHRQMIRMRERGQKTGCVKASEALQTSSRFFQRVFYF